jgi:hypothetical protein
MYVPLNAAATLLLLYASQYGLPYVACNLENEPIAFIFPKDDKCQTHGFKQVLSERHMLSVAERWK